MHASQSRKIDLPAQSGERNCCVRERMARVWNRQAKKMEVPHELMALISYLRQQEAAIQERIREWQGGQ